MMLVEIAEERKDQILTLKYTRNDKSRTYAENKVIFNNLDSHSCLITYQNILCERLSNIKELDEFIYPKVERKFDLQFGIYYFKSIFL